MDAYFTFTDECGQYKKERNDNFRKAHPYYVRSNVIISLFDFLTLQENMGDIKKKFGVDPKLEIKWSHYGNAVKNKKKSIPGNLSSEQIKDYFLEILKIVSGLRSAKIYYTVTDNNAKEKIKEEKLLKMHIQNALQRVQMTVSGGGFAVFVTDDLNNNTKILKKATYEMMSKGDFLKYKDVKKGIYMDFSDQCPGLQVADIYAGIFTASLKYEKALKEEKHKFQCAYDLFFSEGYKKTRSSFNCPPYQNVDGTGVSLVPSYTGNCVVQKMVKQIEEKLDEDLQQYVYENQLSN